jgi:cytosine/uracil/thiamine/allantoin permease
LILPDIGSASYTGFMAKALDVDIAWIVGLIVSGGVYWFLAGVTTEMRTVEALTP